MSYFFEEKQELVVRFYDVDAYVDGRRKQEPHPDLNKHQFVGQASFQLGSVMGARGQMLVANLNDPAKRSKKCGQVVVRAEEEAGCADVVHARFFARKLDNKDGWFGKSDPFIRISRGATDGGYQEGQLGLSGWKPVFTSEVIQNNLSPTWAPFSLLSQKLCGGDPLRPLLLEVFDHDKDGCVRAGGEERGGRGESGEKSGAEGWGGVDRDTTKEGVRGEGRERENGEGGRQREIRTERETYREKDTHTHTHKGFTIHSPTPPLPPPSSPGRMTSSGVVRHRWTI